MKVYKAHIVYTPQREHFEVVENGYIAVSMKDDWTTIYGDGVTRK